MFMLLLKQRQLSSPVSLPLLSSPPSLVFPQLRPLHPRSKLRFYFLFFGGLLLLFLLFILSLFYCSVFTSFLQCTVHLSSPPSLLDVGQRRGELQSVGSVGAAECFQMCPSAKEEGEEEGEEEEEEAEEEAREHVS